MSTRGWLFTGVVALALGVAGTFAGCGEEAPPEPEPEVAVAPPEPVVIPDPTADEIPVPEDFAAEAAAEINDENYEAELQEIEEELAPAEAEAP